MNESAAPCDAGPDGKIIMSREMFDRVRVEPRPESLAAAAWWASRLGRAEHDLGTRDRDEREKTARADIVSALMGRAFTDEQVAAFQSELGFTIEQHLIREEATYHRDSWRPHEPQWGSGCQAFGCDYGPEWMLTQAAEEAGFKLGMLDLPLKTVMWVNPGEVKVREGVGGDVVTVWEDAPRQGEDKP